MAHPYTTFARVRELVASQSASDSAARLLELLDRDGDGVADDSGIVAGQKLVDATIKRACNRIDGEVAQVYVVPLTVDVSTDALAATAGLVADIADQLTAAWLFLWADPTSEDGKRLEADALDFLDKVRARRTALPGQTLLDGKKGRSGVRFESIGTLAAGGITSGRTDQPYTDDTVDQTYGL